MRYEVKFAVQVWAETPQQAFFDAALHVAKLQIPPAEVLVTLPTASITGAPRTPDGPGWRLLWELGEDT